MPEEKYESIEKLGKYRVLAEIGRGGMARVFRAENTETGEIVAIKALLPELAGQPSFVKRFKREIETLRVLEHPGIVKIFDIGQERMIHYYAMEYMDGATVEKQFRLTGKMSVPDALRVTRSVAEALQYAHAKGVVHRDIKLANILTNAAGEVKLTDFGIAKDVEATRLTVTGGIVGTADYMSPEQAEGRRITRKSDVYSLGVCLYQMLTGRLPFVGRTYMDVIRAHRFTLPESPKTLNPALPRRVARLVEMMMEKDPDKRLSSAGDVLALVDAIESTDRELTEEELASAREMVRWALVADYDWRRIVLRIVGAAALIGATVLCAIGLRYRYLTTAEYKFSVAMEQFGQGNFEKAKGYFEDVSYFHPDSNLAAIAAACKRDCIKKIVEKGKTSIQQNREDSTALAQYKYACEQYDSGDRDRAISVLKTLATDFAETEGGRNAAARLVELGLSIGVDGKGEGAPDTPQPPSTESQITSNGPPGL